MNDWAGKTAVITGAASGLGLEASRIAARRGMSVVMADVREEALDRAADDVRSLAAAVLALRTDVAQAAQVDALGAATVQRFGVPHLVFNNAGVGTCGLLWEHSAADWDWVVGVNLVGVAHGIRVFVPLMLDAAAKDASWRGHVVNTASMAGLLSTPNLGLYNATKAAVVSLSETLYHDLALVTGQVHAHVLCPHFVSTGIHRSHRHRPADAGRDAAPTVSQRVGSAMMKKAVTSALVPAAEVAGLVFDAMDRNRFYVYSHPQELHGMPTLMEDRLLPRNPTDPFAARPEIGQRLRAALRAPR
jgi:NAD(P)-dependent dehydrogenase (short-subunit alcohol dehydrogenase family)